MKYPGGYQIIDMKGLEDDGSPIIDSEIIEKLEYSILLKKPLYIVNYKDNLEYADGPILMNYNVTGPFFNYVITNTDGSLLATLILKKEDGKWYFTRTEA